MTCSGCGQVDTPATAEDWWRRHGDSGVASFHVHFDGQAEVELHVCERHRAIGVSLPCPDGDCAPDSDCAHVQTRPCTCVPRPVCDGCGVGV